MEVATVFLETSLSTRLAVSFPASATTVADLKRRVADEHAAAFPHIGHVAVQAIKVNQRGALYQLTDSMAVRDAFRGVTGAWHLQLQLDALHLAHHQMPQLPPHCCNCKPSSEPSVPASHQHDSVKDALGCRKRSVSEMLIHQQAQPEAIHTETERAPREKHRAVRRRDADSDFGLLSLHKEPCSMAGKMCNAANSKELAPCVEELNQGDPCSEMQVEEKEADSSEQEAMQHNAEQKEPLTAKMCGGEKSSNGTHLPPPCAADSTKQGDYSENEAMRCRVDEKETRTARVCNSNGISHFGTHPPPPCAAESTKEGGSSENETTARQVEEKGPLTVNVRDADGSSQGSDHPPPCAAESTKERDSSENEATQPKFEEKEAWAANACNHGSSTQETTHLPPCDELIKEVDSSESEAMQHKLEEKETRANRVCNGETSSDGPDLPHSTKECDSYEKEAMTRKVEEKEPWTAGVWNGERSSQATDLPPPCVAESTKEGDSSKKEAMQRKAEEKETWPTRVCNGEGGNNGTDLPPPCATKSTKEGDSSEEEAMQHKVEEKVCNRESSSNWTDLSPGDESMNEDDSSENDVMKHEAEEKEPWTDSVCKGGGSSHWSDPIEWTDAEQRAWEMALEKRRRPRIAVRKMPNSRAAKLYGYS